MPTKPPKKKQALESSDGKTLEEIYQKVDQVEHILLRPDSYVGSVVKSTEQLWVYDSDVGMNLRNVSFVPALFKIFDEILVNAADNFQRDPSMDVIKVDIDRKVGKIVVYNNGAGIPVEIHDKEKIYIPELIFGHLLTSSNYDDSVKKVTGGRNGYGAKLTNIYSKEFIVETTDTKRGRKFKQVYRNNMSERDEPEITSFKNKTEWTRVTFTPDLSKFGMSELDDDTVALFTKRVYDIAGCNSSVKVYLNGDMIPLKNFSTYVDLYFKDKEIKKVFTKCDRWEVCVCPNADGQLHQVSFVNSINTTKGGTHVGHVVDKISKYLSKVLTKKNKSAPVKPAQIKNHLWVFVNCLIENPAFSGQTKETLTTRASDFGSSCDLPEDFMKKVAKTGIVDLLLSWAKFRENTAWVRKGAGKSSGRIMGIAKLDDANMAGKKTGYKCTLILTEGDSAKSLAVGGLSILGRDYYGVFPLRGKLLNVRDASFKKISENEEIRHIMAILGLKPGKEYADVKQLRYGHLMIMTDQDHDGSHIKGLLINFIHHFWPSLIRIRGFIEQFITPIVKVKKAGKEISFFSIPEYLQWKESTNGGKGWSQKYYKGLGTSTTPEMKEYFKAMERHKIAFQWTGEADDQNIELAFSKSKADARKDWLLSFKPGIHMDWSVKRLPYTDFINKELILFSVADNMRSIPSMVDGLKPGQRKIMYSCFKLNLTKEMKVQQLGGYVGLQTAYHHGEQALYGTIIGLAQNFVGSNNINLLFPSGQFGTRLMGGKDAASARYISTNLSEIARKIFHPADDALLEYLEEDGISVEPRWYVPVIPMVLVNGSEGIGTGWSTFVPNHNPRDVIQQMYNLLDGKPVEHISPWYRGFQGTILEDPGKNSLLVSGNWEKLDETSIRITELPIRMWTQQYKEFLEEHIVGADTKKETFITDYKEHHGHATVDFTVYFTEEHLKKVEEAGLAKKMKLEAKRLNVNNMHLFDPEGRMRKYANNKVILQDFYHLRLNYYEKRKDWLIQKITREFEKLSNRVRFIIAVINNEIIVSKRKRADLVKELVAKNFKPFPKKSNKKKTKKAATTTEQEGGEEEDTPNEESFSGYDYLLSMPLWNLTWEKVEQLKRQLREKEIELDTLIKTDPKDMWRNDLKELSAAYDKFEKQMEEEDEVGTIASSNSKRKIAPKSAVRKTTKPAKTTKAAQKTETQKESAPTKRPRAKKAKGSAASEDEGDDFLNYFSPVKATKPALKKTKSEVIKTEPKEAIADLSTRLAKKGYSTNSKLTKQESKKAIEVEEPSEKPPPKKRVLKATKGKLQFSSDSEGESNTKNAKKPAAAKATQKRKQTSKDSDSDSDISELTTEATPPRKRSTRATTARVNYKSLAGTDEEIDQFSDVDGSDFEL